MEMDAQTRANYEAWVRRRIIKRVVLPAATLLILIIGIIAALTSGDSEEENQQAQQYQTCEETECNEAEQTFNAQPTYEDFDFATYNELAVIEHTPAYLDSYLILVNKVFKLPAGYTPRDLTIPQVLTPWDQQNITLQLRETAARALEDLFTAAFVEEGLTLWLVSGYRSYEDQIIKHQQFIDTHGYDIAQRISAKEGHSEHQTGLAVDVTSASVGALLTEEFSNVPEGVWVRENAHRFGFIIRYPYRKMDLTGIGYEPWHLRYVGTTAANEIFEQEVVLEQYVFPTPVWDQP